MQKKHAKAVKLLSELLLVKSVPDTTRLLELVNGAEKDMKKMSLGSDA